MHLAAAVGTPTVALFGGSAWNLWTYPCPNLWIVSPAQSCDLCRLNRFRNKDCLIDVHVCMDSCDPTLASATLDEALA